MGIVDSIVKVGGGVGTPRTGRELVGFLPDQAPRLRRRVTIVLVIDGVFVALVAVADHLLYPERPHGPIAYGIAGAAACLTLSAIYRLKDLGQYSFYLGVVGHYVCAITGAKLVVESGGFESPYFLGFLLLQFSLCILLPARPRQVAIHSITLVTLYLGSLLLFCDSPPLPIQWIQSLLLGAAVAIGLLVLRFDHPLRISDTRTRTEPPAEKQRGPHASDREQEPAETERRCHDLVENASDAIFVIQDHRIIFANPKTSDLLGGHAESLSAERLGDLVAESDRPRVLDHLKEVRAETLLSPFRIHNQAGQTLWVDLRSVAIRWQEQPAMAHFLRDISETKRLQAKRQDTQKMEAMGTLAGGVAHDFNNLLTAISGNIQVALLDLDPEEPLALSLQDIAEASERASNLTRQLVAFSRQQVSEPKVLDLNHVLDGLRTMVQSLIGEDIELRVDVEPHPAWIEVDPDQIEEIIINLSINARDAMPAGGRLTLTSRTFSVAPNGDAAAAEYVALMVSDTGSGLDAEAGDRLFEPFFAKSTGRNTGLGLATAYGIVKQHGGTIQVSSEPGQGTTFEVVFPRHASCSDERP